MDEPTAAIREGELHRADHAGVLGADWRAAMVFVRFAMVTPRPGQADRARELIDDLLDFHRGREGFVAAYRLLPDSGAPTQRLGRISIWESEEHANRTAQEQRDLSLQSALQHAVLGETHEERSFQAIAAAQGR